MKSPSLKWKAHGQGFREWYGAEKGNRLYRVIWANGIWESQVAFDDDSEGALFRVIGTSRDPSLAQGACESHNGDWED